MKTFGESTQFSRFSTSLYASLVYAMSTPYVTSARQLAFAMSMSLDQVARGRPARSLLTGGWQFVVVGRDMFIASSASWLRWICSVVCDFVTFAAKYASHTVSAIYNALRPLVLSAVALLTGYLSACAVAAVLWVFLIAGASTLMIVSFFSDVVAGLDVVVKHSCWIGGAVAIFVLIALCAEIAQKSGA